MADFPTSIYEERETENLPGIVFDANKKQNLYSEDFQNHASEITAIETYLKSGSVVNGIFQVNSALPVTGNVNMLVCNSQYIFITGGSSNRIYKYDIATLTKQGETASYGYNILSLYANDIHIFFSGAFTFQVRKCLISDMSFVADSASYTGIVYAITGNATHIFIGGQTLKKVRKILISDMSTVADSADYGGTIYALSANATHLFVGGATTQIVRKILISNMSTVVDSANFGGVVRTILLDSLNFYVGGETVYSIKKYLISDMSLVLTSSVFARPNYKIEFWGNYVVLGSGTSFGITIINKTTMQYVCCGLISAANDVSLAVLDNYVYSIDSYQNSIKKYLIGTIQVI